MTERVVKVVLRGDVTGLVASMRTGSKAVADSAREMTAATKEAEKFRGGLHAVGTTAGQVGLTAGIGLGLAAKAAMDWETAWTGVNKTVNGTTAEMADLEDGLRDLAKTLPSTHTEIAAVAEAAGQLGVAREDIVSFTKTMVDLGQSTNLSAEEAATSIAQMANVMGTAPDQIDNLGASLVALGNAGASTEADILSMATRLSGSGKLVGASESDVLALANAMSSMGIEAELGGGAMGRTLTKIYSATKAGGDQLEGFAKIAGMSGKAFATAFGEDPIRAVDSFIQGLNRIDESGGNAVQALGDVGIEGTQDLSVLLRLKGSQDLLTRSLDLGTKSWAENTALAKEAGQRYDTTASKAKVAWNQIKDDAISVGDAALPVIAKTAEGVGVLANAFGDLPGPVHEVTAGLLGITAVTGGSLWFGAKVINGIASTRKTLSDLGVTAANVKGKLSSLGAGVRFAGLVGGLMLVNELVENLSKGVNETDLSRNLEAFANGLPVADFDKMNKSIAVANSGFQKSTELINEIGAAPLRLIGGSGDTALDKAQREVEKLDQALAGMVEGGNADKAAAAFDRLANTAKDKTGTSVEDTGRLFDAYGTAVANAGAQSTVTASASETLASSTSAVGASAATSAEDITDLIKAMEDQREAALGAFDAETQYRQALKDAREQADKNNAGIKGDSEAALENRDKLSALAAAWDHQSDAVRNNKKRYQEARSAFIETAVQMGVTRGEAKKLATQFLNLPDSKVIPITTPGMGAAISDAKSLIGLLNRIGGFDVGSLLKGTSTIATPKNADGTPDRDGNPLTLHGKAAGGRITGPGTKTSDSVFIAASAGEFMQQAAAVDYYGLAFMEAVNDRRFPRFAAGGSIGGGVSAGLGGYIRNDLDLKMPRTLKQWEQALAKNTKVIDKETEHRDDLVSSMESLKSTVTDMFRPDLFSTDRPDNWAYMSQDARNQSLVNDPIKALQKSISNGTEYEQLLRTLAEKKLDGPAYEALARSGDIERVRAYAGQSAAQLGVYESLFNKNQAVSARVGAYAGNVVYSKQIAESNRELRTANGYHAELNHKVDAIEKAIRHGATTIARGADRSRNRTATNIRLGRGT